MHNDRDPRNDRDPTAPWQDDDHAPTIRPPIPRSGVAVVGVGGVVGTALRYQLGVWFPQAVDGWPVTTFLINTTGALLLGLLLEALVRLGPESPWRRWIRLGLGTGMLGSFTTYSTLAVDADLLLRAHQWWAAASYLVGTVLAGLAAAAAGIALGARVRGKAAI